MQQSSVGNTVASLMCSDGDQNIHRLIYDSFLNKYFSINTSTIQE